MEWFSVDKQGLRQVLARKGESNGIVGIAWLVFELVQNVWDTDATECVVTLTPIANKPYCEITVKDDHPTGFTDLSHAWTLFAESEKKGDPEKRGRFNLGEKLVLALCEEATISSTTGTVVFDKTGRHTKRTKTEKGSVFHGIVRMTREEYDGVCQAMLLLIQPAGKKTTFNGVPLAARDQFEEFTTTLATEVSDAEGNLKKTARKTSVTVFTPLEGETPMLYEMGIPVVELSGGEPWHLNVHQKVPLNVDRDNVTPGYLRDIRTAAMNALHQYVKGKEAASTTWVREAMSDERATAEAVTTAKVEAFGIDAVTFDPNDLEANKAAAAAGYTVIPGGSLPKGAWENIRKNDIVAPAGRLFPTKMESVEGEFLDDSQLSLGMQEMRTFVKHLGKVLLGIDVTVFFYTSDEATVAAQWGARTLSFNVTLLKKRWFDNGLNEKQVDLILHEFGHHFEADHLSKKYNDALTRLGAKLAFYVAANPTLFKELGWSNT